MGLVGVVGSRRGVERSLIAKREEQGFLSTLLFHPCIWMFLCCVANDACACCVAPKDPSIFFRTGSSPTQGKYVPIGNYRGGVVFPSLLLTEEKPEEAPGRPKY